MTGRILVVDDVATNRIILKVKLASACYEVLEAKNGECALQKAREEQPDLVLLDMAMPGLDGLEVCKRLKADPMTAGIPVIMITSYNDTRSKLLALESGAEEYLTKPLDDIELMARVRSLLRASDISAELALREGTAQALGFAEAATGFAGPARIALVAATAADGQTWHRQIKGKLPDRISVMDRAAALQVARMATPLVTETTHCGDATPMPMPCPDVFVIAADLDEPGYGLMLLSELRASPATRHAAIIIGVSAGSRKNAAMALDLGASDIVNLPLDADELVLRLGTQIRRKRQSDRLRDRLRDGLQLAVTDPLTGLYNRRYALSHLDRIHRRACERGKQYAVLQIDLDKFKSVNDQFGHAAGDHVLRTVADRLSMNLRNLDLIARMGGEEFLIVLPEISADAARSAAERLRTAVEAAPIHIPDPVINLVEEPKGRRAQTPKLTQTISIGLAFGGGDGAKSSDGPLTTLAAADRALYRAKAEGRNQVTMARPAA